MGKKVKKRNEMPAEYEEFMNVNFCIESRPTTHHTNLPSCSSVSASEVPSASVPHTLQRTAKPLPPTQEETFVLRSIIKEKNAEISNLELQVSNLKKAVSGLECTIKSLKGQLKDQGQQIITLKARNAANSSHNLLRKINRRDARINEILHKNTDIQEKLTAKEREHDESRKVINSMKTQISFLKKRNQSQKRQLKEVPDKFFYPDEGSVSTKEKGNTYNKELRQTVQALIGDTGIAAGKCSQVIEIVGRYLFGHTFSTSDLPSKQTCLNIASEGHVLAKLQSAEAIIDSNHVTLHSDATSREKRKYVGQQVTLDNGTVLSLGFNEVSVEDSSTLLETTINLLDELADVFTEANENSEKEETFLQMLRKVECLMSDRASVMKSFNQKFQDFKQEKLGQDVTTHFLHCNAHFLLGLATGVEATLKTFKREFKPLGRDKSSTYYTFSSCSETATLRLIRTAADILGPKGDEKSGCREEWLAYCSRDNDSPQITSYRANRFNNIFENSSAILYHKEDITSFLKGFTSRENKKVKSVLMDIEDENILLFCCAVALLDYKVTRPYWKLVNSNISFFDFIKYAQKFHMTLADWCQHTEVLLDSSLPNVFEDEFATADQNLLTIILETAAKNSETVKRLLDKLLSDFLEVAERQLAEFLENGPFGGDILTMEQVASLKECPVTNLKGEHAFGDLDFSIVSRRNATLHHRTTCQILKWNKTSSWLTLKDSNTQQALNTLARKLAPSLRKKHKQQEEIVKLQVRERLEEIQRKKKMKKAQVIEERSKLMQAVVDLGDLYILLGT